MKRFIILFFALFLSTALFAQSAKVITEIIDSEEITYGQACYLSAVSQNLIGDDASYEDAITALSKTGQIPPSIKTRDVNEAVKLVNLSFIYTQMLKVKGGLMFRITKGSPRYSFKLLKSDGILPQNYDPTKVLSGKEALSLFTTCNLQYGEPQFMDSL